MCITPLQTMQAAQCSFWLCCCRTESWKLMSLLCAQAAIAWGASPSCPLSSPGALYMTQARLAFQVAAVAQNCWKGSKLSSTFFSWL